MKLKYLFTGLLFVSFLSVSAQDAEPVKDEVEMSADRPGASTGTDITSKFKIQWETGFGYERNKYDGANEHVITINTSLFRYGISESAEIRLQVEEQSIKEDGEKNSGLCPLVIGTKVKIFDGYKAVPKIGLLANLTIPCGKDDFKADKPAPQLYLLFDNEVTEKISIGYNVGAEYDGDTHIPTTFAAICLGYAFTNNFCGFIENYNYFHCQHKPIWMTEFGVSWQVAPRVQLDLACDLNLKSPVKNYAVSCGVAWLIN